jgi:hypothetical protein
MLEGFIRQVHETGQRCIIYRQPTLTLGNPSTGVAKEHNYYKHYYPDSPILMLFVVVL